MVHARPHFLSIELDKRRVNRRNLRVLMQLHSLRPPQRTSELRDSLSPTSEGQENKARKSTSLFCGVITDSETIGLRAQGPSPGERAPYNAGGWACKSRGGRFGKSNERIRAIEVFFLFFASLGNGGNSLFSVRLCMCM